MAATFDTHQVTNQPPPLSGHDVFGSDVALTEALKREGGERALPDLHELGLLAGSQEAQDRGVDRRTRTHRFCAPTTATGTDSTSWTITPPTTSSCRCRSPTACTLRHGPIGVREPMSCVPPR